MNVAMVIHSQTGHTEYLAHKIGDMLKSRGQKSDYLKLNVTGSEKHSNKDIKFKEMPDLSSYDTIIFGSHVEAFRLAEAMQTYLDNMDMIEGKKAICLLTQALPFKWMGAGKALRQMEEALKKKGADVTAKKSISWSNKQKREAKMIALSEEIIKLI